MSYHKELLRKCTEKTVQLTYGRQVFHDSTEFVVHLIDYTIGEHNEAILVLGNSFEGRLVFGTAPQELEEGSDLGPVVILVVISCIFHFSIQE